MSPTRKDEETNAQYDEECIFCNIIRGEAEASFVSREKDVVSFMTIDPFTPGHLLVVPRRHSPSISGLDEKVGGKMLDVARRMTDALQRSELECQGVNLIVNEGRAAGQIIDHVHLHVIPRFEGDGIRLRHGEVKDVDRETLDGWASEIRSALG